MLAINAIADKEFSIEAAIAKLPANVKRLAAAADLPLVGTLTVAQVDAKLSQTRMSITERLTLKVGLERLGLLL